MEDIDIDDMGDAEIDENEQLAKEAINDIMEQLDIVIETIENNGDNGIDVVDGEDYKEIVGLIDHIREILIKER